MAPNASSVLYAGTANESAPTEDDLFCPPYPNQPERCQDLASIRRGASGLSLFASFLVAVFIFRSKRLQSSPAQRLVFWLTVATAFFSLSACFSDARTPSKSALCQTEAFCYHMGIWAVLLWLACITFNVSWNILGRVRTPKPVFFEKAYHAICWSTSAFFASVVIALDGFGNTGEKCGITGSHKTLRFATFYGPCYVIVGGIVLAAVLIKRKAVQSRRRTGSTNNQKRAWQIQRALFTYPLTFLLLTFFPFVHRMYQVANGETSAPFALAVLHIISGHAAGCVISLNYFLGRSTVLAIRVRFWSRFLSSEAEQDSKRLGTTTENTLQDLPPRTLTS